MSLLLEIKKIDNLQTRQSLSPYMSLLKSGFPELQVKDQVKRHILGLEFLSESKPKDEDLIDVIKSLMDLKEYVCK